MSTYKCCVKSCKNCKNLLQPKGITFHRIPAKKLHEWLNVLNISPDDYKETFTVCSVHFEEDCINRTLGKVRLKDHAIPTLLLSDGEDIKENIILENISMVPETTVKKHYFQLPSSSLANTQRYINTENISVIPPPKIGKFDIKQPCTSFTESDCPKRTLANKSFDELFGCGKSVSILSTKSSPMQATNVSPSPSCKPSPASSSSTNSTKLKRQRKFISSIHSYSVSPGKYKRMYLKSVSESRRTKQYLSRAKNIIKIYKKRVTSLRAVVQDLRKQNLVSDAAYSKFRKLLLPYSSCANEEND